MKKPRIIQVASNLLPAEHALGGGLEGAANTSRETATWNPSLRSPDALINPVKRQADARARDLTANDGFTNGASQFHRDSIVGASYMLNADPDIVALGPKFTEEWAEEFQLYVESRFTLYAESPAAYMDASGINTLTGQVRLAVMTMFSTGEVIATAEWDRGVGRAYSTCLQMISSDRLSNQNNTPDTADLRRGIQYNPLGRPMGYWFQMADPGDIWFDPNREKWRYVQAAKPWGRRQVIHIFDQNRPDQSRGIADLVAAMKTTKMTKKFQDITLQNAVINASFAAAIESELPPDVLFQQMGGDKAYQMALQQYMEAMGQYIGNSNNIAIDGAKIPHLFPGTKLSLKPMGTPGGVGTEFEHSLLRHTAAALGMSYEEFARDFSNSNYSSIKAGAANTRRYMQSRKKTVADRYATEAYMLVLEEMVNAGDTPRPAGVSKQAMINLFYQPLMKEALARCTWIGAGSPQIDELKETQAALLRIQAGLSTWETESAKLGTDWRLVFKQRKREEALAKTLGISFDLNATKPLQGPAGDAASADGGADGAPAPAPAGGKTNGAKKK